MAVLLVGPEGRPAFDVPRELLTEGCGVGDAFGVRSVKNAVEGGRASVESRRLLGALLGRGEGRS